MPKNPIYIYLFILLAIFVGQACGQQNVAVMEFETSLTELREQARAEQIRIQKRFEEAVEKSRLKLLDALEAQRLDAIKNGKLDEALQLRDLAARSKSLTFDLKTEPTIATAPDNEVKLGAFSVSLAVKDIQASREFYEKLGFTAFAGDAAKNWLILKSGEHAIGLFQGMFEKNIMTFNPGWDSNAQPLTHFTDVRELQRQFKARGIEPVVQADEATSGAASMLLKDPDGNEILFDQHR